MPEEMDGEENSWSTAREQQCYYWPAKSPEIVEIGEDNKSIETTNRDDDGYNDVYVAVGKNDVHVVKWAIDHVVSPGSHIYLVHVFPAISYISTPVGRLSRSQLSPATVQVYLTEENNRRRALLEKYIRLCNDAQVAVDTMLVESDETAKAILELIPVANITKLVMGTARSSSSWRPKKARGKGEYVKKNAPAFCEVSIVSSGNSQVLQAVETDPTRVAPAEQRAEIHRYPDRNFFECMCFSGKFE